MRGHITKIAAVCLLCGFLVFSTAAQDDESANPKVANQRGKSERTARSAEESSSKDTQVDLSPPKSDAKEHPTSGVAVSDAEDAASDVEEFHAWDPHKAAKDIEVGNFYFKRKNYRAAAERYKEALDYKPNDALANFRLAECQEKAGDTAGALTHYQEYLKILPYGPFAPDAQKALDRLKGKDNTASKQ
jgi:tetratricopeptide (TPR) repeat protein